MENFKILWRVGLENYCSKILRTLECQNDQNSEGTILAQIQGMTRRAHFAIRKILTWLSIAFSWNNVCNSSVMELSYALLPPSQAVKSIWCSLSFSVKLQYGGNTYANHDHVSGMLLISRGNSWGLICGSGFSDTSATVACTELGYQYGLAMCCNTYGWQFKSTFLNTPLCVGNETSLTDCPVSSIRCSSYYRNYASVYCSQHPINKSR